MHTYIHTHCVSGWFRVSCFHFYMYGLSRAFRSNIFILPFSISVDKRQDTLIVIAGLVVLVHKFDLWRHKISHPFTICFGGGTWVGGTVWQQEPRTASTVAPHGIRWPRKEKLCNFPQKQQKMWRHILVPCHIQLMYLQINGYRHTLKCSQRVIVDIGHMLV
jgi:hypothetical protein